MNSFLVLFLSISLFGCSSLVTKKNDNLIIKEVGADFKQSAVVLSFNGNYSTGKGNLKSAGEEFRKKKLLEAVELALSSSFNTGAMNVKYIHTGGSDGTHLSLEGFYKKAGIDSKNIMNSLFKEKFQPEVITFAVPTDKENVYFLSEYKTNINSRSYGNAGRPYGVSVAKYSTEECDGVTRCYGRYGHDLYMKLIAGDENHLVFPSMKIKDENQTNIPDITLEEIKNLEKEFNKKYEFLNMPDRLSNILLGNFGGCTENYHVKVNILKCISNNHKINGADDELTDKTFKEMMVKNEYFRSSVWGIMFMLNTEIDIKRENKESFQINLKINSPDVYKKTIPISKYVE
jgi:hypothetical protein